MHEPSMHERLESLKYLGGPMNALSDEIPNEENEWTKKRDELNDPVTKLANHIKQRWTHPDKFREIADSITNILGRMMRGGEVTVKNEELQHYRNNIVNLYELIGEKFPDGKHFDVIWRWVKSTLYNNLRLRMVVY